MGQILVFPAPPSLDLTEAQWQNLIVDLARYVGWNVYHTHDSRGSDKGFPDLTMAKDRLVMAELKTEKGKIKPEQHKWIADLKRANVEVYLWRPRHWYQVLDVLTKE